MDRSVKKSIRVCNVRTSESQHFGCSGVDKGLGRIFRDACLCQVPKNLDDRDIQEAFEDIGRVVKCEVGGCMCWLLQGSL